MKELGQYLKETRINNGVSVDEAAQDLNIDSFLLESIEEGNTKAFKDILSMKDRIKDYAKYLGLKPEEVIDEFNGFLFEHTSKISLDDIKAAQSKIEAKEKKVHSPYTKVYKEKVVIWPFFVGFAICLIIALIVFLLINITNKQPNRSNELSGCYDFVIF